MKPDIKRLQMTNQFSVTKVETVVLTEIASVQRNKSGGEIRVDFIATIPSLKINNERNGHGYSGER